ncbi:MAG: substrate-binding domain-containing protein, partial [Ruminococcus sp.]|nr:substrate-binding domain-containing protein [Ruminococcus sp.]
MKMNTHRRIISTALSGAVILSLATATGCGKKDEETYVAVIVKSQSQYWEATKKGVEDAGKEMKIKVTYDAPEKEDTSAQIEFVKNAVANKADAIVIAPVEDTDELAETLKNARNSGISVIAIDTALREESIDSCISTNSEYAGAISARKAYELLGGTGEIGIVTHQPTSPLAIARKGGFERQIEEYQGDVKVDDDGQELPPTLSIVATETGEGALEKTRIATLNLLK